MLVRITSRPSSSSQPMEPWVSNCAWEIRAVCQVPPTVMVDAASVASTSPPNPSWNEEMTLRSASNTRSSGVRSG
ncbi:Uncharacterised protein [Mycobacteroides abscessus subsp. abscessus]|nr:Uncharacterised protein [Mycobacteroides abscessus subsp. abscessus]